MIHCKDCKFWTPAEFEHFVVHDKICMSPKFVLGYGNHIKLDPDQVQVEDDEGWGFSPGPLFGCIHGEKGEKDV